MQQYSTAKCLNLNATVGNKAITQDAIATTTKIHRELISTLTL